MDMKKFDCYRVRYVCLNLSCLLIFISFYWDLKVQFNNTFCCRSLFLHRREDRSQTMLLIILSMASANKSSVSSNTRRRSMISRGRIRSCRSRTRSWWISTKSCLLFEKVWRSDQEVWKSDQKTERRSGQAQEGEGRYGEGDTRASGEDQRARGTGLLWQLCNSMINCVYFPSHERVYARPSVSKRELLCQIIAC